MEQIAEQIADGFIQELPEKAQFFTPEELLTSKIPLFVVKELERTVATTIGSKMNLPDSEWIQTESNKVQIAWLNFVEIAQKNVKIPSGKLRSLLEKAVLQCLELAVHPRQSVPEYIFKKPDQIDYETLEIRVTSLNVNHQLGVALLRYMEKKEKTAINFDEARDLIRKIDQKMVEDYHPLNWAQILKPVFELAGPNVDSKLLRIFFEDKGKLKIARKFDLLSKEINETEFIEIMSSAELLEAEGYEDTQSTLFVDADEADESPEESFEEEKSEIEKPEAEPEPENLDEPFVQVEDNEEDVEGGAETEEESEEEDDGVIQTEKNQENIVNLFSEIKSPKGPVFLEKDDEEAGLTIEEPDEESISEPENVPLLNKFMFDEGDAGDSEEENEEEPEDDHEPSSIYEEMNLVKENPNRPETSSQVVENDSEEEDQNVEDEIHQEEPFEELSYKLLYETEEEAEPEEEQEPKPGEIEGESPKSTDDKEDVPMWRSFLERDDIETESGYEYEEEESETEDEEGLDEDGFIEEPIYDMTITEEDPEEKISGILKYLNDDKDRFVEEIFNDSEIAYEQALIEIMDFNDWKKASNYLEREVFSRNRIDVYAETAVDFTDRLHSYFMENKS